MAIKPVDAVGSFQFLVDSIPEWRSSLTELIDHTSQRHSEFVAEYSRLLHQAKPRKQKSPSLCSVRSSNENNKSGHEDITPQIETPNASDFVEISPLEAGNRFLYAQAHRKRKPGTSLRSGASGPVRFRNKQMAVIYYDAHIQAELDKLVKGFGAARNNLRKGKNAYAAATGFQLPTLGRRYEHITPGSGLEGLKFTRSAPRLPTAKADTSNEKPTNSITGEAAFMQADKELESMQTLCETAAHQAIRDGDCKLELDHAYKNLDTLLPLAESALQSMKAEEEKRKREEQEKDARANLHVREETSASSQSTLCETDSIDSFHITSKTLPSVTESLSSLKRPPVTSICSAPAAPQLNDAIEVDDDDDQSSIDIDIEAFRMANTGRRVRA